MHLKSVRRMQGLCFSGWWRWTHHFLLVIWLLLLAATLPNVDGYFLGETKAVLKGCEDHWTLQDRAAMPLLLQMTLCVDIRVVIPGAWVAFSYSSVHAPRPELGLEGDDEALYGWLLKVRHRFPIRLAPTHWHRVCLRRDVPRNSFSLEVDGEIVAERRVIAQAIPPQGSLWLGCRPRDKPPGAALGEVELYMFRMWADTGDHGLCEDGTVIGWNARFWGVTSPRARQRDPNLMCDHRRLRRHAPYKKDEDKIMTSADKNPGTGHSSSPGSPPEKCEISEFCPSCASFRISQDNTSGNFYLEFNTFNCDDNFDAETYFCHIDIQKVHENGNPQSGTSCDVQLTLSSTASMCKPQHVAHLRDKGMKVTVCCHTTAERWTFKPTPVDHDPTLLQCTEVGRPVVPLNASCNLEHLTNNINTKQSSDPTNSNITTTPEASTSSVTTITEKTNMTTQGTIALTTVTPSNNHKAGYNDTAVTPSTHHTAGYNDTAVTPSTSHTAGYNDTAVTPSTHHTAGYNDTAVTPSTNHTAGYNDTAVTPSTHHTAGYNDTAVTPSTNHTAGYNDTAVTPSTNHTAEYNDTAVTPSNNHTAGYNETAVTPSTNHTAEYNETAVTPSTNHTAEYNETAFTPSTNHTAGYNDRAVTPSTNHTAEYNDTAVTPSTNHTAEYNETAFTPSTNHTAGYNDRAVTPSTNHTAEYNDTAVTPSTNHTAEYNETAFTPSTNHTGEYNDTAVTPSTNHTAEYNETAFTPSTNLTAEYNETAVTPSTHHTAGYNDTAVTPSTSHTAGYNDTAVTPSTHHTAGYNDTAVTPSTNHTAGYNDTAVTPSTNHTAGYNDTAVTPSTNHTAGYNDTAVTPSTNHTAEYNDTAFTPSNNHTAEYNDTAVTPSNNHTAGYNDTAVTPSTHHTARYNDTAVTPSTHHTARYNDTAVTPSTHHTAGYNDTAVTPSTNHTAGYNDTAVTPSNNHTAEYNDTAVTPSTNHTAGYNDTAVTPSTNHTAGYNETAVTPSTNHTAGYNDTAVTPSTNHTTEYNETAVTPSTNHTGEYNETAVTPSTNHTAEYNETAFTPSTNHTAGYNDRAVTPSTNHTAEYNDTAVTPSTNRTAEYNETAFTPSTNHTGEYNDTAVTPSTNHTAGCNDTAVTPSTNHTAGYNETAVTPSTNHTAEYNETAFTPSTNHTAEYNETAFTPSTNHTAGYNDRAVTPSTNHTAEYNDTAVTPSTNHTAEYNETAFTPSTNLTAEYNETAVTPSTNHTAEKNEIAVTPSTNHTAEKNEIAVTPSTNHTAEYNDTAVKPSTNHTAGYNETAVTPSTNHTAEYNDTAVTPSTNHTAEYNDTAVTPLTASSFTTHLTTRVPGVNTTTTEANTSLEASTSTIANTTTPLVSLTASTETLQTTTLTNTSATKPGTSSTITSEMTTKQEAQEEQANQLLNQTKDVSQLNSSQVAKMVGDLEKLLDGPTVSQAMGQKAVNVISNLMEGDSQALSASANRLIHLVEDLGLKLVVTSDKELLSSGSLVLAVKEVDGTNFPVTYVDIFNTSNIQIHALSRSRVKRSGSALGSVILPASLNMGLGFDQQKQANRIQFSYYAKSDLFQDAALDNQTLVSPVLAASVANLSISNLTENIEFTIRNVKLIHKNYTASCAFWDFTQNGAGGGWRSAGCFLVNATPEETTCSCNHLTSFAILMDISREGMIDRQQAQILTFITYIGCGISAIFLALTLLTYLSFEKLLRDIPAKILVQLCLSLLLLNLVFLLDGWLALHPATGLCISTAFFLHYFLLTSFTWAGLEALHMYLSIVQVFTPYVSRYMLKFSLIGWGIPLLVVIVIISVDKDNYGLVTYGKYTDGTSDDFCWLRNNIAFYVGVVAYFLLIFALCLLVFIVVMIQLSRIKKQNPQNQPPNRGIMKDLRSIAGLIILLGFTWGFALFAWGPLYFPFVYLFTIFNSLQGFLVFIFHCAVKESVRRQWRTHLCCGKLRLAENSDWSCMATQCYKNRPRSVVKATTSAPTASRSSSVISDGTNSSATVLNEIHRRTPSSKGQA